MEKVRAREKSDITKSISGWYALRSLLPSSMESAVEYAGLGRCVLLDVCTSLTDVAMRGLDSLLCSDEPLRLTTCASRRALVYQCIICTLRPASLSYRLLQGHDNRRVMRGGMSRIT